MNFFLVIILTIITTITVVNGLAVCGDGIVSPGEMCDTLIHKCCGPNCMSILPVSTVCRPSMGVCDPQEVCSGLSHICPNNTLSGEELECRPAVGICDIPESCNGCGPECPTDLARHSTYICNLADKILYPCELDTYCPGTLPSMDPSAKVCPVVEYKNGTLCRGAVSQCDEEEYCDPSGMDPGECPSNLYSSSITSCENDNLGCSTETCDGTSTTCNTDTTCVTCSLDTDCPVVDATCATGVCLGGSFLCDTTITVGFCLIDGECYSNGEPSPYNDCQICDTSSSQSSWTNAVIGTFCDTLVMEGSCSGQDTCDGSGVCVDIYLSDSFTCRGVLGDCDVEEVCSGSSDYCPDDEFLPSNETCRVATGICDWPETCTGHHPNCPDDGVKAVGSLCREITGICDIPEVCDGTNKTCPTNNFRDNSFQCRIPTDLCDAPEFCTGLSDECPIDLLHNTSHICRGMSDLCDAPEYCNGTSIVCPLDEIHINGTLCRAPTDLCDSPEFCDGIVITCPPDEVYDDTVICRPMNGTCNPAEYCLGQNVKSCPIDIIYPDTFVCRAALGPCEFDTTCLGESEPLFWACPPRQYKNDTTVCNPANGICDKPELCDGFTELCPLDVVKPITEVCRLKAGPCDKFDFCDGVSKDCGIDEVQPSSTDCHSARGPCENVVKCDGVQVSCPSFSFKSAAVVCRVSDGGCDPLETCDPLAAQAWLCPNDIVFDNTTFCRSQTGVCGTPTYCDGNLADCPTEVFLNSSILCRAAATQCDEEEYCTGIDSLCPTNTFSALNFPCNADALNCTTDECNGFGTCVLIQDDCECHLASDCPVNATCIIPSCMNGFCSEALAPNTCFIDGTCYEEGVVNPVDQCSSCQPSMDPTTWQYSLSGSPCQTMSAEGICSGVDTCDGMGNCIDNYLNTTCRAAVGLCDIEEVCSGSSDFCPIDTVKGIGIICRNATDICDIAEYCTVNDPYCPIDSVLPANTSCALPRGFCEEEAFCRGSDNELPLQEAKECPTRLPRLQGTLCRASVASCDATEYCNGTYWDCPDDIVEPITTVCRMGVGPCDEDEYCDGNLHICPTIDIKKPNGFLCSPPSDNCEQPAYCDGSSDSCPSNLPEPNSVTCYISQDLCDNNVNCDGSNITCPTGSILKANGIQCHSARGDCEGDGFCDGNNIECQFEGFHSTSIVCRTSTDICDPEEKCPGNYWECPLDLKRPDNYSCPNAFYCDGDELCQSGVCQPAIEPRNCTFGLCATGVCNEATNECGYMPTPPVGDSCYSGPNNTANVGICRSGTIVCDPMSASLSCQGEVLPTMVELCDDNVDNNCNGIIDEGCVGLTCTIPLNCFHFAPSSCHNYNCTEEGVCEYSLMPGFCFVNNICYAEGTISPFNPCKSCQPLEDIYWFYKNDTLDPSDNDICNGIEKCYHGEMIKYPGPITCFDDLNDCTLSTCDPIIGCTVAHAINGTNCTLLPHQECTEQTYCDSGTCFCNGTLSEILLKDKSPLVALAITIGSVFFGIIIILLLIYLCCPTMGLNYHYHKNIYKYPKQINSRIRQEDISLLHNSQTTLRNRKKN